MHRPTPEHDLAAGWRGNRPRLLATAAAALAAVVTLGMAGLDSPDARADEPAPACPAAATAAP